MLDLTSTLKRLGAATFITFLGTSGLALAAVLDETWQLELRHMLSAAREARTLTGNWRLRDRIRLVRRIMGPSQVKSWTPKEVTEGGLRRFAGTILAKDRSGNFPTRVSFLAGLRGTLAGTDGIAVDPESRPFLEVMVDALEAQGREPVSVSNSALERRGGTQVQAATAGHSSAGETEQRYDTHAWRLDINETINIIQDGNLDAARNDLRRLCNDVRKDGGSWADNIQFVERLQIASRDLTEESSRQVIRDLKQISRDMLN